MRLRRVFVLLSTVAVVTLNAAPASAQAIAQPSPADVVRQLVEAVNSKQWAAAEALFTRNVIAVGGPCESICRGPAMIVREGIMPPPEGALRVGLVGTPQVSGSTVTARIEVFFTPLPPELAAIGFQRVVQLNSFLIEDGKIAAWSAVDDVADSQTQALNRLDSTPESSDLPQTPSARDGQTLSQQPAATRIQFLAAYGDDADRRWVVEHDAQLAR